MRDNSNTEIRAADSTVPHVNIHETRLPENPTTPLLPQATELPGRLLNALLTVGNKLQIGKHTLQRNRSALEKRYPLLSPSLACYQSAADRRLSLAGQKLLDAAGSTSRAIALVYRLGHVRPKTREREALEGYGRWRAQQGSEGPWIAGACTVDDMVVGALCTRLLQRVLAHLEPADAPAFTKRGVERAVSELLDVLDTLSLLVPDRLIEYATDYAQHRRAWRARRLLRTHLREHPSDAAASALYQRLRAERSHTDASPETLRDAVARRPEDAGARLKLAAYFGNRLDFVAARNALAEAAAPPTDPALAARWREIDQLEAAALAAANASTMPALTPSAAEIDQGQWHSHRLALACQLYRRYGTLQIDNIFDRALIGEALQQFLSDYRGYLTEDAPDDALSIGHRRRQISLALNGVFNRPAFYADPFLLTLMHQLIGRKVVIGSMVAATSLPGAKAQHWHKDHRALFTEDAEDPPLPLPPVAITVMIPLVTLDAMTGSTSVKKSSHLLTRRASEALESQTPRVSAGSCFLMDLALSHRGEANRSHRIRPIVNMVYQQHWFTDHKNFKQQRPLLISPQAYRNIPDAHRRLFDWATQPGARVNR